MTDAARAIGSQHKGDSAVEKGAMEPMERDSREAATGVYNG